MARFRYRAVMANGAIESGLIDAATVELALGSLRQSGARPLDVSAARASDLQPTKKIGSAQRKALNALISELAVLLNAGLALDRALTLAIANVEQPALATELEAIVGSIREGIPLSRAMAQRPDLFSPTAAAMAEAGESNGQLGAALTRLATMLEQGEALRGLVVSAMIYPIVLLVIAVGVILMMLLFVVPQFEGLFNSAHGKLPAASLFVMNASHALRTWWLPGIGILVATGLALRQWLATAAARARFDAFILKVPQFGDLARSIETARFARTLGALIDGEVPLPNALSLATRTIGNRAMHAQIARVAEGVKEGSGLTTPLAAARVLPRLAIGFLRTGEETSQLGPMLERLADVLDRAIKVRLERLVGVLTPAITVILGASVASIVAAIMSAIIGFNDLAISQ